MRFVYATDLHGNRDAIEQVFALAQTERADAIVFGGDLTPKSVAIKLAQYPDSSKEGIEKEEDVPLLSGETIPTDMLQQEAIPSTFSQCLQNIKRLNEEVGADDLAECLERKGSIIVEQTNQYYNLDSMLAEQVLLDKLFAFFGERIPSECVDLLLSNEEVDMVRDLIVEWFRELEATWDEHQRMGFARKCSNILTIPQGNFENLAPSKYIEECILCGIFGVKEVSEIMREIEELLRGKESRLADHLLGKFHTIRDRLLLAISYRECIDRMHMKELVKYSTIARLRHDAESPVRFGQGQAKFLREYFLPFVRKWRSSHGNTPIYAMLGNDDVIDNISLLEEAEHEGLLYHLHGKVREFGGGFLIAGYGFVETLPPKVEYRAWVKDGSEILSDLRSLRSQVGQNSTIWVVHNPPLGYLDDTKDGHVGSKSVLQFFTESQPQLALFGHIHEAPSLFGSCTAQLGNMLCVNPGGEHGNGLQAVVINTETMKVERR